MELHCPIIICGGPEFNYSSEGAEATPPFFPVVFPPPNPPPFDTPFNMAGCLYVCISYISQEDADLCALRQSVLCTTTEDLSYSAPAICCVTCPDGSEFCYNVPAGMFIAKTLELAEQQAQAYACQQAQQQRICIGPLPRCTCVGSNYAASLTADRGDLIWTLFGFLPPGLDLITGGGSAVIAGTPTTNGTYSFQIIATAPNGSYSIRTFVITVVEVTTTTLDDFDIGVPYSFQLSAAGGSGNYTWSISSGTLPDGLDISQSGLISGTPSVSATGGNITFEVRDATCEAAERIDLTPRVALAAVSTTTVLTHRGFSEYTDLIGTGQLYKRVDYAGSMTQIAFPNFNSDPTVDATQCGGLQYIYMGFDRIDNNGNVISRHQKNMMQMCNASQPTLFEVDAATNLITPIFNPPALYGYCWPDDPESCSECDDDDTTWSFFRDDAVFGSVDYPTHMLWTTANLSHTATVLTYAGNANLTGGVTLNPDVQGFPKNNGNGVYAEAFPFVRLVSSGGFSATLSEPYTDANAEATKVVYTGTSKTAENAPNYSITGANHFITRRSRTTAVAFTITCTRLIVGRDYQVTYELFTSAGVETEVEVDFTADDTTHVISEIVPDPDFNQKITVRNPRIRYA